MKVPDIILNNFLPQFANYNNVVGSTIYYIVG